MSLRCDEPVEQLGGAAIGEHGVPRIAERSETSCGASRVRHRRRVASSDEREVGLAAIAARRPDGLGHVAEPHAALLGDSHLERAGHEAVAGVHHPALHVAEHRHGVETGDDTGGVERGGAATVDDARGHVQLRALRR